MVNRTVLKTHAAGTAARGKGRVGGRRSGGGAGRRLAVPNAAKSIAQAHLPPQSQSQSKSQPQLQSQARPRTYATHRQQQLVGAGHGEARGEAGAGADVDNDAVGAVVGELGLELDPSMNENESENDNGGDITSFLGRQLSSSSFPSSSSTLQQSGGSSVATAGAGRGRGQGRGRGTGGKRGCAGLTAPPSLSPSPFFDENDMSYTEDLLSVTAAPSSSSSLPSSLPSSLSAAAAAASYGDGGGAFDAQLSTFLKRHFQARVMNAVAVEQAKRAQLKQQCLDFCDKMINNMANHIAAQTAKVAQTNNDQEMQDQLQRGEALVNGMFVRMEKLKQEYRTHLQNMKAAHQQAQQQRVTMQDIVSSLELNRIRVSVRNNIGKMFQNVNVHTNTHSLTNTNTNANANSDCN